MCDMYKTNVVRKVGWKRGYKPRSSQGGARFGGGGRITFRRERILTSNYGVQNEKALSFIWEMGGGGGIWKKRGSTIKLRT